MRASALSGMRVYRALPEAKRLKKDGTPRAPKKVGKIRYPVFTPDGRRVVGYMVRLPDVVGMIKQPDRFVALDALDIVDDLLVARDDKASFDDAAARRLGIDLDTCIIWTGMDVRTSSGKKMGYCADMDIDASTGIVRTFSLTAGSTASMLLGDVEMPASYLKGYEGGFMVVDDRVTDIELSGGAAAKAAVASVKVKQAASKGAKVLDEQGSAAVDKGSRALGRQLGRAKGMFASFADEYKKASGAPAKKKRKG